MSDDLNTEIKIGADASGVEAGVGRAKRSLATLGDAATKTGSSGRKSIEEIGFGGDKAAKKVESATRSMQNSIQRLIAEQKAGAKGSREYYEALADSKGISRNSLKPLLDQLDAAKRKTEAAKGASNSWLDSLRGINGVLAGIGVGVSIGGITALVKQSIDAADSFSKLSAKSGVAVESLRELNYAASLSDVSTDSLATGLRKLSQNMAAAAGGAKLQTAAFDAIGVSVKNVDGSLKGADEMLKELASKFATFKDGPEKAALAIELFGKQGAEMIPLLNGGAAGLAEMADEANRLGIVFDGDLAKNAEAFNDNLTRMQTSVQGAVLAITKEMLPTLNKLAQAFVDAQDNSQSFATWLGSGLRVVTEAATILIANVSFTLKGFGREIAAIGAQFAALGRGDLTGFSAISDAVKEDGVRARKELDKFTFDLLNARFLTSKAGAGRGTAPDPRALSLPEISAPIVKQGEAATKAVKAVVSEYDKLIQKLSLELPKAAAEAEAAQNGYNKAQTEFVALANSPAWSKFTSNQRATVAALFEQKIASEAAADATKAINKANEEAGKAREKYLTSLDTGLDKIQADIAAQIEATERMGLSKDAVAALDAAKLEMLATDTELQAIKALDRNLDEATYNALKRQAAAYRDLAKAKQQGAAKEVALDLEKANEDAAKKAADEWQKTADSINQSLTDALLRGFESGKDFAKNLRDTVVNMLKTMVLRPVISAIVSPVGAALGGLGALSGAANAAQGAGGLGGVGTALSGIGALSSAFGTGMAASFTSMMSAGIGGWATAAGSLIGTGAAGGIAAGLGMIAAPLAAAALLWKPLFGRTLKDAGIQGTFGGERGFEGEQYKYFKGGLFRSDKTEIDALDESVRLGLANTFKGMRQQVGAFADALKLDASAIADFTTNIKVSTQGLSEADAQKKFEEALKTANNELAEQVLGTWTRTSQEVSRQISASFIEMEAGANAYRTVTETVESATYTASEYAKTGEKAIDTLSRLATSMSTVNAASDALGYGFQQASLSAAAAASNIVDAFGGLEAFSQTIGSYLTNFYSDAERKAATARQVARALGDAGLTIDARQLENVTRPAIRAFVESIGAQFGFESKEYVTAVQQANVLATITEPVQQLAQTAAALDSSANDAARAAEEAQKAWQQITDGLLANQTSLAIELLREMGKKEEALALERAEAIKGFDAYQIGLYDANQGTRALIDSLVKMREISAELAAELPGVVSKFLTPEQNTANAYGSIAGDLIKAGLSGMGAGELTQALTGASKQEIAAAAVAIYNMVGVTDEMRLALVRAAGSLADLKDAALDSAKQGTDSAYAALEQAVQARRTVIQETLNDVKAVFEAVRDNARALYGEVDSTAKQLAAQGRAFIDNALNNAQSTGYLPDADKLQRAIADARSGISGTQYASQFEADRDRLVLAGKLSKLQEISGDQLTEAEKQLKALDDILVTAKAQMDELRGINAGVLSIGGAIAALASAMGAERAAGGGGGGRGTPASEAAAQVLNGSNGAQIDLRSGIGYQGTTGLPYLVNDIRAAAADLVNAGQGVAVYEAIKSQGFTLAQGNAILGIGAGTAEEWARAMGLPVFHSGTDYVPKTGLALLQQGEAVIPAAINRGSGNSARLEVLVEGLTAEVKRLQGIVAEGNEHQRTTADLLDNVTAGGNAMRAETVGA